MNKQVKNSTAVLIIIFTVLFLVFGYSDFLSPGNSNNIDSDYNDEIVIDATSMQLNLLKIENENLKKELEKYQNSPENLLVELRNSYEAKDYDKANNLIEEIHQLANGTSFDIEAQKYAEEIEVIKNTSDIEKAKNIIEIQSISVKKNYYYADMFKDMTLKISYKINTDKPIYKIVFSIIALDSKENTVNFYTYSSNNDLYVPIFSPSNSIKYAHTWNYDWNNMSISKAQISSISINYVDGSTDILTHSNNLTYILSKHIEPVKSITPTTTDTNKEIIVYITNTGSKYHKSSCSYLSQSKISINKSSALKQGYTACSRCNP